MRSSLIPYEPERIKAHWIKREAHLSKKRKGVLRTECKKERFDFLRALFIDFFQTTNSRKLRGASLLKFLNFTTFDLSGFSRFSLLAFPLFYSSYAVELFECGISELTLFNDFIHWFSLNLGLLSVEPPDGLIFLSLFVSRSTPYGAFYLFLLNRPKSSIQRRIMCRKWPG